MNNIFTKIPFSDHPSLLGVRLPPDTEIIKYTSSIVGPKIPGTTTRGRKKTISDQEQTLQLQQKNVSDSKTFCIAFSGLSPAKRARLEMEYAAIAAAANAGPGPNLPPTLTAAQIAALSGLGGASSTSKSSGASASSSSQSTPHLDLTGPSSGRTSRDSSSDRVEVIKLPPTITSNGAYNLSNKNKDIHDLSGTTDLNSGVNLSLKPAASSVSNTSLANSNVAGATITIEDFDAPLNLSMKPDKSSSSSNDLSGSSGSGGSGGNNSGNTGSNSLQSLSSITAALGSSGGGGGIGGSVGGGNGGAANSSNTGGNSSSNSSSASGAGGMGNDRTNQPPFKEGRPRNLGRGVSKPKKNTVASLLAQSRAVGMKPMLSTQQLLQQGADIVSVVGVKVCYIFY